MLRRIFPRRTIPSEDILAYYGPWTPPNQEAAEARSRTIHVHHYFFDVWSTKVRDLKEFGVGHMLYFYFLNWMGATFLVLTLMVGIPNMLLNYEGKYFDKAGLEIVTLGNFGRTSVTHDSDGASILPTNGNATQREEQTAAAFLADASLPPATEPINKAHAIVAMSILDTAGTFGFFLVSLFLTWLSRHLASQADNSTVTVHDYSISVGRLPPDTTAQELVEFFNQYGEVVNVELVRAYGQLVRLVVQRGKLVNALQLAIAKMQRMAEKEKEVDASLEDDIIRKQQQLQVLADEIRMQQAQAESKRVVGAFVTFKEEVSKTACLKSQSNSLVRQWFSLRPEQKLRGWYGLFIKNAPEPSDINYENIEFGKVERTAREALVGVGKYTALLVGFALISLASALRYRFSFTIDEEQCQQNCKFTDSTTGGRVLSKELRATYQSCASTNLMPDGVTRCTQTETTCYRCFCVDELLSGALGELVFCSPVAQALGLQYASTALTVCAVNIINQALAFACVRLTLFEKHHTRSQQARSLMHKLFLSQFLNSAISTIVANAALPGLARLVAGTQLKALFFQGVYSDLTPNWYKMVGVSLIISQFVQAGLRVGWVLYKWAYRTYSYRNRHKFLTQAQLEAALTCDDFELDTRYGEHMNMVYVSMLLSGGLPISYAVAAFWFISAYWYEKWELLRLSKRPVAYGSDLAHLVIDMIPYAVVWHIMFALWAFSLFGVPESRLVTPAFKTAVTNMNNALQSLWSVVGGYSGQAVTQRLLSSTGAHLLALFMMVAGVLFLRNTLLWWIKAGKMALVFVGVLAAEEKVELTGAPEYTVAVRTQLLVGSPTYAISAQEQYQEAFRADDDDAMVQVGLVRRDSKQGYEAAVRPRQASEAGTSTSGSGSAGTSRGGSSSGGGSSRTGSGRTRSSGGGSSYPPTTADTGATGYTAATSQTGYAYTNSQGGSGEGSTEDGSDYSRRQSQAGPGNGGDRNRRGARYSDGSGYDSRAGGSSYFSDGGASGYTETTEATEYTEASTPGGKGGGGGGAAAAAGSGAAAAGGARGAAATMQQLQQSSSQQAPPRRLSAPGGGALAQGAVPPVERAERGLAALRPQPVKAAVPEASRGVKLRKIRAAQVLPADFEMDAEVEEHDPDEM